MIAAVGYALVSAALVAAVAGGVSALVQRRHRQAAEHRARDCAQQRDRIAQILSDAPTIPFPLAAQIAVPDQRLRSLFGLNGEAVDLDTICSSLGSEGGDLLREAAWDLRQNAKTFDLVLTSADGARHISAQGTAALGGPVIWFSDVTAQEHERQSAWAQALTFQHVFDNLPVPLWRRDDALRVVDCNAAYARAVDRSRDEAIAEGTELQAGIVRDAGRNLATRAREAGEAVRETHHVVIDGARRLMEVVEVPLGDGSFIGMALDHTRVEELESELSRHISAQAEVLESLGTAIAIYGPDLHLRFYNGAYVNLWGLEESFLDQEPHLTDIMEVLREHRRLPEQSDFRAFKRERTQRLRNLLQPEEELMHRPDGSTLRLTMAPHPFGGVLITHEDVTDRLTLERNFNTLIEVQRATIDNLYEAVCVFGADGRLTLFNQVYAELWNLPPDALEKRPHVRELVDRTRDFFPVADERWAAYRERVIAHAAEPESRHGRLERSDGKVLDWAQVPLPDGQSLFTYLDVTDSIRVERALREQAEALETADRLKSEFIANISYELRTPLNAIIGFAEILENEFFGKLNQRQREYAEAIVQSSQRLIGLINDILDLATIEAGYMELEHDEVDVRALLADLQTIAHERARNRDLALKIDCPKDIGSITADARRLKQALFNLLSNAINFTPEGGRVTVAARRGAREMRFLVSDTGVGIPQEEQEQVFGKFVRGQPRKSGAGLGLSLVKSLIELHGGCVKLESAVDSGGTRVTCMLPLKAQASDAPDDGSGEAPRTAAE